MYRITTARAEFDIRANWAVALFGTYYFFKGLAFVMSIPEDEVKEIATVQS